MYFKNVSKMFLNVWSFPSFLNIFHDLKGSEGKYNINIDECGETFYSRHMAKHPAAVIANDIKSLDPLRAKKTIIRKNLGHTTVLAIKAPSVTL